MIAIAPAGGGGHHVFLPESRDGLLTHDPHSVVVRDRFLFDDDDAPAQRLATVLAWLATLAAEPRCRIVGLYQHGWATGIQCGATVRNLEAPGGLADQLARIIQPAGVVALMACSTASAPATPGGPGGDGGFADRLRDALCARGATRVRVLAHVTAGHATRNPYLRAFVGGGDGLGGTGGYYVVSPGSPRWRAWIAALRAGAGMGVFRHRMLAMTDEAIHAELGS